MKKLMFLLPIAALAMASCSNSDDLQLGAPNVSQSLQVYPVVNGLTRGTVWDNSNFAKFHLTTSGDGFVTSADGTGTATAIDADVTKTNGKWEFPKEKESDPATTYYWPSKKNETNFFAYAPTTFKPSEDYTASSTDLSKLEDIVVAYNSGSASDFSAGVPLNFRHATSQIVIKADNAAASKIKIEVKGIRLNNITDKAAFTAPTTSTVDGLANPWTLRSSTADFLANLASPVTLSATAADITGSNPLLLLPQQLGTADIAKGTGQYLSVLVKITKIEDGALVYPANAKDGADYAWAAVDVNTNWESGKRYIYTLHFTENGYGKIDSDQTGGGNTDPGDDGDDNTPDPKPGDDVVDGAVQLVLDVNVTDWVEVTESQDL